MPDRKRKVGVLLSEEAIRRVKKYAQEYDMSRYEVIEDALHEFFNHMDELEKPSIGVGNMRSVDLNDLDTLFPEALEIVMQDSKASASLLQRKLGIGYARAARLLDQLESMGYVGAQDGSKPRQVLVRKNGKTRKVN